MDNNTGYVKLYRSLRDSAEWTLPDNQLKVMMAILLNANYKPSDVFLEGNTRTIQPGQMLTSRENLKKICGKHTSERTIRSAVSNLIKSGFLTKEVTKGNHTIFSINNWEKYQGEGEATKKKTKQRPSSDQAATKSEEGKEGEEVKEENIYSRVFDFWISQNLQKHPKLIDRHISAINGRINNGYTEEQILHGIENYSKVVHGEKYYFNYRWPLDVFLSRSNGFPVFIEDTCFENFLIKDIRDMATPAEKTKSYIDRMCERVAEEALNED